jgi:hypothetical protein
MVDLDVQLRLKTRDWPQSAPWSRYRVSHGIVGHAKRRFKEMSPRLKHALTGITCAVVGSGLVAAPAVASATTAPPTIAGIESPAPLPFPGTSCSVNQGLLPGIPNLGPTGPLGPLGSDGPLGSAGNLPCGLSVLNLGPTGPLGPGGQLDSAPAPAPQPVSTAPAAAASSPSASAPAVKSTAKQHSKAHGKTKSKAHGKTKSKSRAKAKSKANHHSKGKRSHRARSTRSRHGKGHTASRR